MWEKVIIATIILVIVWRVIKWRCRRLALEDAEEKCAEAKKSREAEWAKYSHEAYEKWGNSLSRVPHPAGQLSSENQ